MEVPVCSRKGEYDEMHDVVECTEVGRLDLCKIFLRRYVGTHSSYHAVLHVLLQLTESKLIRARGRVLGSPKILACRTKRTRPMYHINCRW